MASFSWPILMIVNALVVILIGVFVVWKIQKEKKSGYPMQDERTQMISGKAAIGAFWISYAFMLSLVLWTVLGVEFLSLPELPAGWALIAVMLVSSISFALLGWYYGKKGDI